MNSIKIDTGKVKTIAVSIGNVRSQIISEFDELMAAVSGLRNSWKSDNGTASHMAEGAIKVFGQIKEQNIDSISWELERLAKYLYEAVGEQYEVTEEKNKDNTDMGEANPSEGISNAGTMAGVAGGVIANGVIGGTTSGGSQPGQSQTGGVVSGVTGGSTVVNNGDIIGYSSSGAPRYKLPDYVYKGLYPDANGVWGEYVFLSNGKVGRICTWNRPGELSCTYYTLRKLNQRGLSFPCVAGPGNGRNWYSNFDTASGVPSFGGANALEDLVNNLSLPQENIVVSFETNTSTDLKHCGHVMLIDKMYRDSNGNIMFEWSDNYPSIANVNGSNPTKTATLAQFRSQYSRYNGNPEGVVVVGAGN